MKENAYTKVANGYNNMGLNEYSEMAGQYKESAESAIGS
jgi:hypothetical protein